MEKKTAKKKKQSNKSDDYYVDFYTSHPPDNFFTIDDLKKINPYISDNELIDKNPEACLAIKLNKQLFEKTKNPLMP